MIIIKYFRKLGRNSLKKMKVSRLKKFNSRMNDLASDAKKVSHSHTHTCTNRLLPVTQGHKIW